MLARPLRGPIAKRPGPLTVTDLRARFGADARTFLDTIEAAARRHGVRIIDPLDHLAGACIAEEEGIPLRYDISHLRPGYVAESVTFLDETLIH